MTLNNTKNLKYFFAAALLLLPAMVSAAEKHSLNQASTSWILTATALVLFMTIPGLALFYGGLVRSKNVLSVLMQCFAITCVASIVWFSLGYSLAFSNGGAVNGFIGGLDKAFLDSVSLKSITEYGIPETSFSMFQMTFAIITPALVVGGFAERMKFSAMLWFSAIWMLLVYVPTTHWVWGGGFLTGKIWDFAGGTNVHINAGVAAIVTAMVLGNRKGFPTTAMPPHNMTMTITGAAMLWVGWFGFNGGSALAANESAAMAILVTHLSASAGALAWMFIEWKKFGRPSALGIVTGMVAGLGTITPAADSVGPAGALLLGTAAGIICFYATQFIKRALKIDDSLDVFPVHGVGGILGTLMAAVLGLSFGGLKSGSMAEQFGIQLLGVTVTIVWCLVATWGLLKILDKFIGLRVSIEEETEGLDISQHEETGYNM